MSVGSDADVRVASARSVSSAEKSGCSGLQNFHTQSKIEIIEDTHGDGLILIDNVSMASISRTKSWLTI